MANEVGLTRQDKWKIARQVRRIAPAQRLCWATGKRGPVQSLITVLVAAKCTAYQGQLTDLALLTAYRYAVERSMIRSFGDRQTEALFRDEFVRQFQGIGRSAKRKLEALNAANRIADLLVPPSNRLEKLKGDMSNFYSIRINDQWRVIFRWVNGEPHEVRIVDYH
jgi:proteic killer suppression protein